MKKKLCAIMLITFLLLSFSGCKRAPACGEAAAPVDEVVVQQPENGEPEFPGFGNENSGDSKKPVKNPASNLGPDLTPDITPATEYEDYYDCQFTVEFKKTIHKRYTQNDFPEVKAKDVYLTEPYIYNDEGELTSSTIVVCAEIRGSDQVTEAVKRLRQREDLKTVSLSYTGYRVVKGQKNPSLPNLERPLLEKNGQTDGVITVILKQEAYPAETIFSVLNFAEINPEAIDVHYAFGNPSLKIYLNIRGSENLNKAIAIINKRADVMHASLTGGCEQIA